MKANELMIGDWVTHKGDPIQISSIGFACATGGDDDNFKMMHFLDLSPIPLTPEILEKNFTRTEVRILAGTKTHYIEGDDFYAVTLNEYTDSIWEMEYTNCEAHFPLCRVLVAHVHEMQHALKMFGIDKEIVL